MYLGDQCVQSQSDVCLLLAELHDIRHFDNVRQVAAFAGLNPKQHQSGRKRSLYTRLRGKALEVTVMRKLLHLVFGIFKSGTLIRPR